MSQHHIKKSKEPEPPQPINWWKVALGPTIILLLLGAVFLIDNWVNSFPSTYVTANGKIFEIRKAVDGTIDSRFGGRIIYGFEAHVQYELNGQTQDRWLRASDNMPRETLLLKLASHPTECLVYWPPNHPEFAKCRLK